MTVKELKEKLSTIPEDLEIIIHGYDTMPGFYKISHYIETTNIEISFVEVEVQEPKKECCYIETNEI